MKRMKLTPRHRTIRNVSWMRPDSTSKSGPISTNSPSLFKMEVSWRSAFKQTSTIHFPSDVSGFSVQNVLRNCRAVWRSKLINFDDFSRLMGILHGHVLKLVLFVISLQVARPCFTRPSGITRRNSSCCRDVARRLAHSWTSRTGSFSVVWPVPTHVCWMHIVVRAFWSCGCKKERISWHAGILFN